MSTPINRISGMVSGLDTDSLVKKLMKAESVRMNTMKQHQQKLTWQSEGYRQWNTDIFSFRSTTLFNMKLEGSYSTFSATSSNPDSLSGTAVADAVEGTYSYQVTNLAQSATMKSNITIDPTLALTNTPTTLTVTSNDQTGTTHTTTVSVAAGDKIGDVVNKLNTAKDATGKSIGVKAIYDSTLKQFILKTKDTGAKTQVSISSSVPAFLDTTLSFGQTTNVNNGVVWDNTRKLYVTATDSNLSNPNIARDAKINFNGSDVTSSTNNVKIMGVNYALKNVTPGVQSNILTGADKGQFISGTTATKAGTYQFKITTAATKASAAAGSMDFSSAPNVSSYDVSVNGIKIDFTGMTTANTSDLITKINSYSSQSGVTATNSSGAIKLDQLNYGSTNGITLVGTDAAKIGGTLTAGVDVVVEVEDASGTPIKSGITGQGQLVTVPAGFDPSGITMKMNGALNDVSKVSITQGVANTITISKDINTEVKNIKDFVSNYNTMLDKLNKVINEPVYKDYQPLTDDQRSAMSDTQVVQWETKAKSGLFHNDSTLKDLVNNMRNHVTSTVDNRSPYNSLASIGISSQSYQDKGKLHIDDMKLMAALQADPDAIKNLFSQSPSNATDGQKGVIVRLYDDFQGAFTKLGEKAGAAGNAQNDQSIIGKLLSQTNKDITNEQVRLTSKETHYHAQFTAMETAMSKYQSQSSWLTQQLSVKSG